MINDTNANVYGTIVYGRLYLLTFLEST